MHQTIIYGPKSLGDVAFKSLYGEQGILQLKQVISTTRHANTPGQTLFIALQWAQYTMGLKRPIFEDTSVCTYGETKLIKSIQYFLITNQIQLQFYESYVMPLQRENDEYLMQIALNKCNFTVKQLEK